MGTWRNNGYCVSFSFCYGVWISLCSFRLITSLIYAVTKEFIPWSMCAEKTHQSTWLTFGAFWDWDWVISSSRNKLSYFSTRPTLLMYVKLTSDRNMDKTVLALYISILSYIARQTKPEILQNNDLAQPCFKQPNMGIQKEVVERKKTTQN